MFKLVVLCAFVAAVTADPEPGVFAAPAFAPGIIAPVARILPAKNYVYQSPIVPAPLSYSAPFGYAHYIKKRSVPLALNTYSVPSTYIAPASYAYSSPIAYSASAPLVSAYGSGLVYSSGAHLIKKRYATLPAASLTAPYTYISPKIYSSRPLLSAPLSYPLTSSLPYSYSTHFIKKRSAPLAIAYAAPGSYSHQSRVDFQSSGPVTSYTSYATPFAYSSPIAYSHLY